MSPSGRILSRVCPIRVVTVKLDAIDPVDVTLEYFTSLCTIHADTSSVPRVPCLGINGIYFRLFFDVVLLCGLTEIKAQISWMEEVSLIALRYCIAFSPKPRTQGVEKR